MPFAMQISEKLPDTYDSEEHVGMCGEQAIMAVRDADWLPVQYEWLHVFNRDWQ